VLRISTQREFVCVDLGDPERYGDETGVRLPGQALFLNVSQGVGKTWGHLLPGLDGTGSGLQSYPEPCVDAGAGLAMNPADFDGNLQLATVETGTDEFYGVSLSGTAPDMRCLARFGLGMDLDVATGTAGVIADPKMASGAQLSNSVLTPPGSSLVSPPKMNTLYPDGCYSERDRAPAYLSSGNMQGFHGVASFWVKRNYDVTKGMRWGHMFFSAVGFTSDPFNAYSKSMQFFVCDGRSAFSAYPGVQALHFFFEDRRDGDSAFDSEHTYGLTTLAVAQPHRWHLLTLQWDNRGPDRIWLGRLLGEGGTPQELTDRYTYDDAVLNPLLAEDLTLPDAYGAHRFALGLGAGPWWPGYGTLGFFLPSMAHADATLDEFAVYDFGGVTLVSGVAVPPPSGNLTAPDVLAAGRYPAGRYYKGWLYNATGTNQLAQAATYFTPPIRIPAGSFLRRVAWTFLRPEELPDDYPEIEAGDVTGSAWLWAPSESRASQAAGWTPQRPDWVLRRAVPGPFRLKIGFSRVTPLGGSSPSDLSQVLGTPLLDSPVFDDLTILFSPAGGDRIHSWREDEG
jgi:hypothetical protein